MHPKYKEEFLVRHKRLLIGALVALPLIAGGAVAAFAAGTQAASSPAATFIGDVASHLGIQTSTLTDAIEQARLDELQSLVSSGKLSQAQASAIEQRIKSGKLGKGFGFGFGPGHGRHFGGPRAGGPQVMVQAAAGYLGLSAQTIQQDLRGGQTLAALATAQGKTVQGLENAITAAMTAKLQQAVTAGKMTQAQATTRQSRLQTMVQRFVNGQRPSFGPPPSGSQANP